MKKLAVHLKYLMSHAGINPSQLARYTGIAQPIIHRLVVGQNLNPKLGTLQPIASYFKITVSELIGEEPIDHLIKAGLVGKITRVPLIQWQDALQWSLQPLNQHITDYVKSDVPVHPQAFALQAISSDILFQASHHTLIFEPTKNLIDKNYVLIHKTGEETISLKQIIFKENQAMLVCGNQKMDTGIPFSSHYKIVATLTHAHVQFS